MLLEKTDKILSPTGLSRHHFLRQIIPTSDWGHKTMLTGGPSMSQGLLIS